MVTSKRSVEFLLDHGVLLNNNLRACQVILASSSVTMVCSIANFIAFESSCFVIDRRIKLYDVEDDGVLRFVEYVGEPLDDRRYVLPLLQVCFRQNILLMQSRFALLMMPLSD